MNTPFGFVVWLAVVVGFVFGFLLVGEWVLIRQERARARRVKREAMRTLADVMFDFLDEMEPRQ